ncbi:glycerol-3-phosphate dehydrogenase/oxidase [Blattabacterium cuenoti]|uniref:glycerol-3-phosphate dehydrogenase/oxidase n=1 Tax=Blattabacterium cuenoti TaxID=1653831 RepID=UPI00163D3678|nr:glycerol-3-phosphate dehydrogenase/oxidase [Blattabacterium cuenoti]
MKHFLNRKKFLNVLKNVDVWDIIIIGGGATGVGIALDSSSRGYKTLLLEQEDFSKGTSSRSTKLIHGGIRYLAQGNIKLVCEALKERGFLLKNAPHLVKKKKFVIPIFNIGTGFIYWAGLKLYEWLSGSLSFGKSIFLSKNDIINNFPEIRNNKLKGGILYYDGQFDDSRLIINIAQTCVNYKGVLLNYFRVNKLKKENGKISGVIAVDIENKKEYSLSSKVVINATGVFSDSISKMDELESNISIRPSQGTHIVLNKSFFSSKNALVIPKTTDGRVLFCVPWYNHILIGTTDTLLTKSSLDPLPLEEEIDFILNNFRKYFITKPKKSDILSAFSGLRPLFYPKKNKKKTKDISRSHKIIVNPSGLINIIGGKWTTYRKMGEDAVNKAIEIGRLIRKPSITKNLKIHGSNYELDNNESSYLDRYGEDKLNIKKLIKNNPILRKKLFYDNKTYSFTEAEVIWMVRHEMARTVEDILARRFRLLFLNARKSIDIAPKVASLMAKELSRDEKWEKLQIASFKQLAMRYYYPKDNKEN